MDSMRNLVIRACMGLRWLDSRYGEWSREEADIYFHSLEDDNLLDVYTWLRHLEEKALTPF